MLRIICCAVALTAALVSGPVPSARAQQGDPAAVAVRTVPAERRAIAQSLDVVGRLEAINRVDVRARVTGYLESVDFKEGDLVAEGAPLYRIEPDLLAAAVKQAEGALERGKAAHQLAVIQLQRAQELLDRNAGTVVARDQARAQEEAAAGAVVSDEANLQSAKINLGYTTITSPIAGRIGRTSVTKGNVVGPDSGVLATIVSQDPIYVLFPISQRELLRRGEGGNAGDPSTIKVRIQFSDGTIYREIGKIDFVNISVDRSTDTVQVRAVMPNPGGSLRDGQLVRVLLESGTPEEKIVVPQSALIADQGGIYVFVVEDGKAVVRRIKVGSESGIDIVVDSGLTGGEQVIVDGLQRVRPGTLVRASPAPRPAGRT